MRGIVLLAIACVLLIGLSLSVCGPAGDPVVTFPDPNLGAAIRQALNKTSGPIYASELAGLTRLQASLRGIESLSGLQHCTNLTDLDLEHNQISDISALANVTRLKELWLDDNQISDISPLANLSNLTYLHLLSNQISDIDPLVQNEGLGTGDTIYLLANPLSSDSINIYIPQLRAKGVTVNY